jgi:catechol 2,3-dioxygenase-like lactoylglutathione lyase family enzyme
MIAHLSLPVTDFERSKDFYSKVLRSVGYKLSVKFDGACGYKEGNDTSFWIVREDATMPLHVAFEAKDKESVEQFYKAARELGAEDNGAPGYRPEYWPGYYAAFVHDPDGHNIEAVWYDYSKEK